MNPIHKAVRRTLARLGPMTIADLAVELRLTDEAVERAVGALEERRKLTADRMWTPTDFAGVRWSVA